jgi:hypothetical protein
MPGSSNFMELEPMAASSVPSPEPARAWWRRGWLFLLLIPVPVAAACWWFTAPLDDTLASPASFDSTTALTTPAAPPAGSGSEAHAELGTPALPDWPEVRLEGMAAKRVLLDTMLAVQDRLKGVAGYTATFRKQERIGGVLGPEQIMTMKIRHHPFAVYFKYLSPYPGKEAVYAEGHHDNKIIAHAGGMSRFLVPRLAVPPDHPLAMAETRHPITEAGLANLVDKLVAFRRLDLIDADAVTFLDRTTDIRAGLRLRSVHTHPHFDPRRPFARVDILYDPQTRIPLSIESYDWPEPGHQGELLLAERYVYEDLDLSASLSPIDFDPGNPAYAFHRY